ncbi:MAG TPA: hypothetical protein VFL85_05540 [Candidatus Saccharimonadales bacterium]|nr:hypothetical protein [Candidatus Saccharimonadales bacterium]
MRQIENITEEQIRNVPPAEVARWMGRFSVMSTMLEATKGAWMEGWGEGGYTAHTLAESAKNGKDWRASRDYQDMLMQQLDRLQPRKGLLPDLHGAGLPSRTSATERLVTSESRQEVIRRVGLREADAEAVAPGALAVYAYMRGDIGENADRYLHAHKAEIGAAVKPLLKILHQQRPVREALDDYSSLMYGNVISVQSYERVWQQLYEDLHLVDNIAKGKAEEPYEVYGSFEVKGYTVRALLPQKPSQPRAWVLEFSKDDEVVRRDEIPLLYEPVLGPDVSDVATLEAEADRILREL